MKNVAALKNAPIERRYGSVAKEKSEGATYTPTSLANFVARQMLEVANLPKSSPLRILDPAVGDGALLEALLKRLPKDILGRTEVYGFDTDPQAIDRAGAALRRVHPKLHLQLEIRNFLTFVLDGDRTIDLFMDSDPRRLFHRLFDLVIANPPYVRTQIIGANEAQKIAMGFGLTGRVDLYYRPRSRASTNAATSASILSLNRYTSDSEYSPPPVASVSIILRSGRPSLVSPFSSRKRQAPANGSVWVEIA